MHCNLSKLHQSCPVLMISTLYNSNIFVLLNVMLCFDWISCFHVVRISWKPCTRARGWWHLTARIGWSWTASSVFSGSTCPACIYYGCWESYNNASTWLQFYTSFGSDRLQVWCGLLHYASCFSPLQARYRQTMAIKYFSSTVIIMK